MKKTSKEIVQEIMTNLYTNESSGFRGLMSGAIVSALRVKDKQTLQALTELKPIKETECSKDVWDCVCNARELFED